MEAEERKNFERTTLIITEKTENPATDSNNSPEDPPSLVPQPQPAETFDDLFSDEESQYDPDDDPVLRQTDEEIAAGAVHDIAYESVKEYDDLVQIEASQNRLAQVPRPRAQPLITPEVLANVSTHNFPVKLSDAEIPTLKFHFSSEEGVQRRHRHTKPRAVKFVYDDPTIQFEEDQAAQAQHEAALQAAAKAAAKGGHKGKGAKHVNANVEKHGKGKGGPVAAKSKLPLHGHRSPDLAPPPPPPPDPIIWEPPVWNTMPQQTVQLNGKKAWIIEKKRRRHWFRPDKIGEEREPSPETRPLLWTKNGERIARQYALRIVVKDPETMQLYFFQRKKRYVLTALRMLFLFAEQSTRMKLRVLSMGGLVRRLVQLTVYRTGLIQNLAVMLMASLSEVTIFIRLFRRTNGLRKIRNAIVECKDPELNVWTMLLLRNLSKTPAIQQQFLDLQMLDWLLDLVCVKTQLPDVVKYILQMLCFLTSHRTVRIYLVVRGVFLAINDLMFSPFKYIQYLTLVLLNKLLRTTAGKPIYRFDKCDGMSHLVTFISDITQRKLFPLCIEIFEYVLQAPAIARKMQDNGLYRTLMDLIRQPSYENVDSVPEFALKCLQRAAEYEEERRTMHGLEYEEAVLYFLQSNCPGVQVAALKALAVMSRRPTNQTQFFDLGAHRAILFIMQDANADIREWGFYALAFLMFRNKHVMESLVKKNIGKVILNALKNTEETWETKGNALFCAILLRKNANIREQLRVYIAQLIPNWLSNKTKRIRHYAAVSIGLFVTDAETREAFIKCKGLKAIETSCSLSQGVEDGKIDVEFVRNLCFGLAALAVDEETVWKMVNAGSLTPIWILKTELDRISQGYVAFAVHRIVSLDRLFKYALLGKLDENDKLPHGLHDQGIISLTNPLRLVEFFLRQPLMADRTVVYISLPKKYWKRVHTPEVCDYRIAEDGLDFKCDHVTHQSNPASGSPFQQSNRRNLGNGKPVALQRLEQTVPAQDYWCYAPYNPAVPPDENLESLLKATRNILCEILDTSEKIQYLAKIVAENMGGVVGSLDSQDYNDSVEVSLAFLKRRLNSNCVSLGEIQTGNALHRALMFKLLADACDLKVALVKGQTPSSGWIEIRKKQLSEKGDFSEAVHVVDLMYKVGSLIAKNSALGKNYTQTGCTLPIAERVAATRNEVRPLRGVLTQARLQLLSGNEPPRCLDEKPDRPLSRSTQGKKIQLFLRPFAGVRTAEVKQMTSRKRVDELFEGFSKHLLEQRKHQLLNFGQGENMSIKVPSGSSQKENIQSNGQI